jgi:ADP-ribosylglycohydrolase/fructose-1,6-bisphosphatase/inositol monophosphatase family enzyme
VSFRAKEPEAEPAMNELHRALSLAIDLAKEAGSILRKDFHRPGGPRGSGSHAEADDEAERVIQKRLLAEFAWNYLGEECGAVQTHGSPYCWMVDPNDGTSAYLKGWRGSAVSIGLLKDGVPVLGVVYAFCYPDGEGDLIAWAEGCPLTRNGQPVPIELRNLKLDINANPAPVVFVSQDADRNPEANAECVEPARFMALPSIAYRLARVAAGDGVAGVSLNAPVGWDYAAGHALLRAVGGSLVDESGREVTYSQDGRSSVGECFGGSPAVVKDLCRRPWSKVKVRGSSKSFNPPYCLVRPERGRALADATLLSRAQGCLLGQLAGDSLGGLIEFEYSTPAEIRADHPGGLRDLRDGGHWRNLAGQPTDDSEMALMLARTLLSRGGYDRSAVSDAYVHWWPRAWDRGGTLSQALSAACRGTTSEERLQLVERHASRERQSNGSLMRISPLGIFYAGRPDEAADWARHDSRLTHPHPVCQDACAVFVAAIATAIGRGGSREECYQAALSEAERSNGQASVREALERAQEAPPTEFFHQMGWVLIALQNAFYQLLHAPSLEEGVVDTVMRGGDTDTNAAIAGALLGAVHGRNAVPARWRLALQSCRPLPPRVPSRNEHPQPSEFWPVDVLELAEALVHSGQKGIPAAS